MPYGVILKFMVAQKLFVFTNCKANHALNVSEKKLIMKNYEKTQEHCVSYTKAAIESSVGNFEETSNGGMATNLLAN